MPETKSLLLAEELEREARLLRHGVLVVEAITRYEIPVRDGKLQSAATVDRRFQVRVEDLPARPSVIS